MLFRTAFWSTCALALIAFTAQPQEAYTITFKRAVKGSTTLEERTETRLEKFNFNELDPVPHGESANRTIIQSLSYRQTILDRPDADKAPTVLKRTYEKASTKLANQAKVLPYQGKTVLIEKKDGGYEFQYEGGDKIPGEDAALLQMEFADKRPEAEVQDVLFPKKAVKVGEQWSIDIPEFIKVFDFKSFDCDLAKSKGTGALIKAYKKDGRQFGDFAIRVELQVRMLKRDKAKDIEMLPGASMVMEIKGSSCIDGGLEDGNVVITTRFNAQGFIPPREMPRGQFSFANSMVREGKTREVTEKK
jgi:hypothetical protein